MASKEYTYGQTATVTVSKTGYRTVTRTYTMTQDITDSIVLEEQATETTLYFIIQNTDISVQPSITVTGGSTLIKAFAKNSDGLYQTTYTVYEGEAITYVISADGYRTTRGDYSYSGLAEDTITVTLEQAIVEPTTHTLTWISQSASVTYFEVTGTVNGSNYRFTVGAENGAAALSGFSSGDYVEWAATSGLIGATWADTGSLTVTGSVVIPVYFE